LIFRMKDVSVEKLLYARRELFSHDVKENSGEQDNSRVSRVRIASRRTRKRNGAVDN